MVGRRASAAATRSTTSCSPARPGSARRPWPSSSATSSGKNVRVTSGPVIEKAGDLAGLLTNLEEGDILFIDEIHRIPKTVEEYLYSAMEDFRLDIMIDQGPNARSVRLSLPRFTLVGATTRSGPAHRAAALALHAPDAARLLRRPHARRHRAAQLPAAEGRRSTRPANGRSPRGPAARRASPTTSSTSSATSRRSAPAGRITREVAAAALELLEIDAAGLDEMDKRMLRAMAENYAGGPVGMSTIAVAVGEEAETLEEVHEPFLIQEGYLQRTPQGRMLTAPRLRRDRAEAGRRRPGLSAGNRPAPRIPAWFSEIAPLRPQHDLLHDGPAGQPVDVQEGARHVGGRHHAVRRAPRFPPGGRPGRARMHAADAHAACPSAPPASPGQSRPRQTSPRCSRRRPGRPSSPATELMLKISPRAPPRHRGHEGARDEEDAAQVGVQLPVEVGDRSSAGTAPRQELARVVDQDVDRPEAPADRGRHRGNGGLVAHVAGKHLGLGAAAGRTPGRPPGARRRSRATSASRAPRNSAANIRAIAAPMPCEAPVTRTTGLAHGFSTRANRNR